MKGFLNSILLISSVFLLSDSAVAEPLPCEGFSVGNEPWISVIAPGIHAPGFGFPCEVKFEVQSETAPAFAYIDRPLSPWLTDFNYTAMVRAHLDTLDSDDEWTFLEMIFGRSADTATGRLILTLARSPDAAGNWSLHLSTQRGNGHVSSSTVPIGELDEPLFLQFDWSHSVGILSVTLNGTPMALPHVNKLGKPRILRAGLVLPLLNAAIGSRVSIGSSLQTQPDRSH